MQSPDAGPWMVDTWSGGEIVLQSDDFKYDVALKISGDFGGHDIKMKYAQELCAFMNAQLVSSDPKKYALPKVTSPEAFAALKAMNVEYNYPANPANCARYGWEAARRYLEKSSDIGIKSGKTLDQLILEENARWLKEMEA